jgi:hypothetical protein
VSFFPVGLIAPFPTVHLQRIAVAVVLYQNFLKPVRVQITHVAFVVKVINERFERFAIQAQHDFSNVIRHTDAVWYPMFPSQSDALVDVGVAWKVKYTNVVFHIECVRKVSYGLEFIPWQGIQKLFETAFGTFLHKYFLYLSYGVDGILGNMKTFE